MDDAGTVRSDESIGAGAFGPWLHEVEVAIRGDRPSAVPCGSCSACCTSSQFVHIAPDETDALAHVPRELTFPAPGLPRGHVLLGYDERGHCPMLVGGACSIYEHRPRTCRTYDCRVFAAAEVTPRHDQVEIARQVRRWRFEVATDDDRARLAAVRAAARLLESPPAALAEHHGVEVPTNPTQIAVLAVEIHDAFLDPPAPSVDRIDLGRVADAIRRVARRRSGPGG